MSVLDMRPEGDRWVGEVLCIAAQLPDRALLAKALSKHAASFPREYSGLGAPSERAVLVGMFSS